jgi:hypothetical protein
MAQKVFQIVNDEAAVYFGKNMHTAAGQTAIEPGLLVQQTSGSTVSLCAVSTKPAGFAYGLRYSIYRPTAVAFAAGEALTLVKGHGYALASSDFFTSGTLPTAGNTLYTGASGLMDPTSGAYKVGYCLRVDAYTNFIGGTGAAQTLALIEFDITPFGTGS